MWTGLALWAYCACRLGGLGLTVVGKRWSMDLVVQGARARGADLQGARERGVDLQGANLKGARERGVDLQGVPARGVGMRGAFRGC